MEKKRFRLKGYRTLSAFSLLNIYITDKQWSNIRHCLTDKGFSPKENFKIINNLKLSTLNLQLFCQRYLKKALVALH